MKTTFIKYGKTLTAIQLENGVKNIITKKVSDLGLIINGLDSFSIQLSVSKLKKTIDKIQSLGFHTEIDESYGFEYECKIYCNFKYN
jgi:hypothetical protein